MIQIDELVLRIPGLSEEEGQQLARKVGERLADRLPSDAPSGRIDALRISLPQGQVEGLSDEIVDQIIRQLNLATL